MKKKKKKKKSHYVIFKKLGAWPGALWHDCGKSLRVARRVFVNAYENPPPEKQDFQIVEVTYEEVPS